MNGKQCKKIRQFVRSTATSYNDADIKVSTHHEKGEVYMRVLKSDSLKKMAKELKQAFKRTLPSHKHLWDSMV